MATASKCTIAEVTPTHPPTHHTHTRKHSFSNSEPYPLIGPERLPRVTDFPLLILVANKTQVEEIVPAGTLDPGTIDVPGVYVNRIVKVQAAVLFAPYVLLFSRRNARWAAVFFAPFLALLP
jgi:hypothetical protein